MQRGKVTEEYIPARELRFSLRLDDDGMNAIHHTAVRHCLTPVSCDVDPSGRMPAMRAYTKLALIDCQCMNAPHTVVPVMWAYTQLSTQ